MARRTIFLALSVVAALAARGALGDDARSRALLERAQRGDAFTLGIQQLLERARAGELGPRGRLELEARQHDQRRSQDALFYRQQMRTLAPAGGLRRRAEAMRAEQERQEQLSRFRFDAASGLMSEPPARAPAPRLAPTLVTAPIPRAPVDGALVAAMRSAHPARPEPPAMIRRVQDEADALWRAALAGDWNAAQGALDDVRESVDALRRDRFEAEDAERGGRAATGLAVLDRLDAALSSAAIALGARDAASVMHSANEMVLAAAAHARD